MPRNQRPRRRARTEPTKRRTYRPRPVSTDLVVEGTSPEGEAQTFTFPRSKLKQAFAQFPILKEKGFTDIRVTNAA